MGMFNYYRKFIPNFAEIAKSIVQLTHKDVKFEWTTTRHTAFQTLKQCLMTSPIWYIRIRTRTITCSQMLQNIHGL